MTEREVGDGEFLDIAKTPAQARSLRRALQKMAEGGAGGTLQEMAREVLTGRVGLRDAMNNSSYREALSERTRQGFEAVSGMSDSDRMAAEQEGQRQLDEYQQEIDEEEQQHHAGESGRTQRHSGRGWSL